MTPRRDGIIRRMKQFFQMYDFVSHVEQEQIKAITNPVTSIAMEMMAPGYGLPDKVLCIKNYCRTHKVTDREARRVLQMADDHGYITNYQYGTQWDTLEVTPGFGVNFVQKVGFVRIGMWRDIMNHYHPLSPFIAIAISILALIVSVTALHQPTQSISVKPTHITQSHTQSN